MTQKIIQQGAEAIIYLDKNIVIKDRIDKKYRLKAIDEKIRKSRTKVETKILTKASKIINTPLPLESRDKFIINMPYIDGKKLSEHLDKLTKKQQKDTCIKIGESLAKIHDEDIIHGDLTTSYMILDKENKVWFIDFGLGFISRRFEDKAVDLHLIKQALEAKHFENWETHYKNILKGYKKSENYSETLERLKKVEARGRYKQAG